MVLLSVFVDNYSLRRPGVCREASSSLLTECRSLRYSFWGWLCCKKVSEKVFLVRCQPAFVSVGWPGAKALSKSLAWRDGAKPNL